MLRHPVTIERIQRSPDSSGGYAVSWVAHVNTFAGIKHNTGKEFVKDGRLQAVKSTRIVMRYIEDLKESDRINFNGRLFQIRMIDNIEERDEWLVLTCEEGVAQ